MVSVKVAALAGFAALSVTAASAADMPQMMPPMHLPSIEESASGWYLRGDIGMTNQGFKSLFQRLYDTPGTTVEQVGHGWDSATFFGIGLGYKLNDWFRVDVTGEYRGKANFHGSDNVTFTGGIGVDNYSGSKSEWVFMANAYVDLGTWYHLTPYVGVGVGGANIKIHSFRDDGFTNIGGVQSNSVAYAEDYSKFNFAWAVHAGLTYKVTSALSIDLGYRYIDLGSAQTGPTRAFDGSFTNGGPFQFNKIYSHDFKLGVRWMLEPPMPKEPMMAPPLMRRG
jgi:opacity protein-like surface antigen